MTNKQMQCLLTYLGYDTGGIDGVRGAKTEAALAAVKADYGVDVNGLIGIIAGTVPKLGTIDPARQIWNQLLSAVDNPFAVAGIMGNLRCESGLQPTNLEDAYQSSLGHTDASYTAAVDDGSYPNFTDDHAGYGLAQWTYPARKAKLLQLSRDRGVSIGDLTLQVDFLVQELYSFGLMDRLHAADSVRTASDLILTGYECPADSSVLMKSIRAGYGDAYYSHFAGDATNPAPSVWSKAPHFQRDEFRCTCGRCGGFPVEPQESLVMFAESMRVNLGRPVCIVPLTGNPHAGGSGVRCAAYNASLPNSVPDSYHIKGKAIDFSVPGLSDAEINNYLSRMQASGVVRKFYKIQAGSFHAEVP